jgi:hypothetical protein
MQVRATHESLQTPEQLDERFSLVAGLYVAALLTPAVVFSVVQWQGVTSWPVAVGSVVVIGGVLTVAVSWLVSHHGELVAWGDSIWVAVLLPIGGALPMAVYFFEFFLFVAFTVTDLQPDSAAHLVGAIGFLLGMLATLLGSYLVLMARTRLAAATVDGGAGAVEWTAGWPHRTLVTLMVGTLAVVGLLFGLAAWQLGWRVVTTVLPGGIVPVVLVRSLVTERTYRATPAGLEQRRENRWFAPRRLIRGHGSMASA